MLNARIPTLKNQALIGLSLFIGSTWLAWTLGNHIATQDLRTIEYYVLGFAACIAAVAILRNWRLGLYFFLIWVLFEDLTRKYLGNNMAIYFAKDALVGLVYLSLFVDIRAGRAKAFRPPFMPFLIVFFWFGVLQLFNSNSPHILYGLMGIKIYFYYMPLMFVGYALIRNDEDLRTFLVVNSVLAGIIGAIGIIQAIVGHSFLNPATLAPELRELGELDKISPITRQLLSLPSAVFVSAGRFSQYLTAAIILTMGSAGYLLLHTKRSRNLIFLAFGIVGVATLFSGSRGALMLAIATVLVLSVAFLWGAPWRWQQAHRMLKAVRRFFIVGALGLATILLVFPEAAASRIAFYAETLLPSSSEYQLGHRSWDYPIYNLELAFTNPNWIIGNGIGTASLRNTIRCQDHWKTIARYFGRGRVWSFNHRNGNPGSIFVDCLVSRAPLLFLEDSNGLTGNPVVSDCVCNFLVRLPIALPDDIWISVSVRKLRLQFISVASRRSFVQASYHYRYHAAVGASYSARHRSPKRTVGVNQYTHIRKPGKPKMNETERKIRIAIVSPFLDKSYGTERTVIEWLSHLPRFI